MKKAIGFTFLVILSTFLVLSAQSQIATIAVLDFEGLGIDATTAKALTNRIRTELVKTGIYQVVERGKMDDILKEQGFQVSGCTSEACLVEAGQLLGVEKMLAGSISKVGKIYSVELRLIDVESGKIEKSDNYDMQGEIGQLLTSGMKKAVTKLINSENVNSTQSTNQGSLDESAIIKNMVYIKKDGSISNDFYMSRYELTQEIWERIYGRNPSSFKGTKLPVQNVSYYDVINFCNLLSELDGLTSCYLINGSKIICDFNKNGYRLPTQEEWLYAAHGGHLSQMKYKYAGSNYLILVAWFEENSNGRTHPVGLKKPNELSLYDMSGNVYEWCWDAVLCGASWFETEHLSRLSNVYHDDPNKRRSRVGFRLCRSVVEQ